MAKYVLLVAKDWKKSGMMFDSGFRFKIEVPESKMNEFLQKCYEKHWSILRWL